MVARKRTACWLLLGGGCVALLAGAPARALSSRTSQRAFNASSAPTERCYGGRPNYIAAVCARTRVQAGELCAAHVTDVKPTFLQIHARYAAGSTSRYEVSLRLPTAGMCWAGGAEHVNVRQQLR